MKQLKLKYLFTVAALCIVLASCHKDKETEPAVVYPINAGLFILNQGRLNGNNSTLTYYDYASKSASADVFFNFNGVKLGDTGNDVEIYGSKTYITVDVSSNLEVFTTKTGKRIKQIPFFTTAATPTMREPRWITFYKNNAFMTAYDGTVSVIDTGSLTVTKTISVGLNPEQMAISNGKLYVCNSGGLQLTPSSTVSVIDLTTLAVTKTITVGLNPTGIGADAYGNVYVTAFGAYPTYVSTLTIINSTTDVAAAPVVASLNYGTSVTVSGDVGYYFGGDAKIKTFNVKTQAAVSTSFVTDGTTFTAPYALAVDNTTGEVFVADAGNYTTNGVVYAFDKTGKKEYSFTAGLIPGKIAIVK